MSISVPLFPFTSSFIPPPSPLPHPHPKKKKSNASVFSSLLHPTFFFHLLPHLSLSPDLDPSQRGEGHRRAGRGAEGDAPGGAGLHAEPPHRDRVRAHLPAAEVDHRGGLPARRRNRGRHGGRRERLAGA